MAPPPEYDKEPKAPDKSATNISTEDSKLLHNLVNDQHTNSDHKPTNTVATVEVENKKHVETLDDGQLKALLDEAINYKNPKDREGKSKIFKELLEEVEQESDEQACEAAARALTGCRGARRGTRRGAALAHSNSLQDLVAALAAEPPRRHHVRAHVAPPAPSVSARAIHGGSLPSGVDTSSLSEEPARGAGYLATVRCVNPPPLAERRVSASDANTPAEMELLNRRSKPMFPMTYTARATLEIGSGAVCSGRAVTTTTASNQVRTPATPARQVSATDPQAKLMNALCMTTDDARQGGGGLIVHVRNDVEPNDEDRESAKIGDLTGKTNIPRGPKQPDSYADKKEDGSQNWIKSEPKHVKRKDYVKEIQKCPQSWVENVDNWYRSLPNYTEPLKTSHNENFVSKTENKINDSMKVQDQNKYDYSVINTVTKTILSEEGMSPEEIELKIQTKFAMEQPLSFSPKRNPNPISPKRSQSPFSPKRSQNPFSSKPNQSPISPKRNIENQVQKESHSSRGMSNQDDEETLSIESYTELKHNVSKRILKKHNLVVATLSDINPRNVRPMSISRPQPNSKENLKMNEALKTSTIHTEADNIPVDINSNTVDIEAKQELTDSTSIVEDVHTDKANCAAGCCCSISKKRDQLKQVIDMFNKLSSFSNTEIELKDVKSNHQKPRNDSFSKYVALQQQLIVEIESLQDEIRDQTHTEYTLKNEKENGKRQIPKVSVSSDNENESFIPRHVAVRGSTQIRQLNSIPEENEEASNELHNIEDQINTVKSDSDVSTELSNNAFVLLTLPRSNNTESFVSERTSKPKLCKKKENLSLATSHTNKKEDVINKNILKVLLFENLFKNNSNEKPGIPGVSSIINEEVDSAISFSCITTPEVVASCNTTSSTSQSAVAVDPKPRSVISSSFNGLPLSRPNYGSTGSSTTDDYKKSLDENGNSVQGFSSPLSGSSQHKKPRRKKSSKNETVIDCQQIDGYQGDKDVNELLRFIESNADNGRAAKLPRVKHKDDSDDKGGKKRSAERRKDKETKLKRATSLEELSRTTIEDLTDVPEAPLRCDKKERRDLAPKGERRSWGDDQRDYEPPDAAGPAAELTDFQTVTKKRKPRRRADEHERDPPRRARPPSPRARRESAPPSDRSNDSNDDMDSVHSLPDAPRAAAAPPAPHASYAEIARTRHNIPDLIESCNFYGEGEGGRGEPRREPAGTPGDVPGDADGYPALDARAAAARRRDAKPQPRRDRKERPAPPADGPRAPDCPAPDVVADRRPPVILLDSAARPRDMDGVTFGFDVNEQLLGGPARRPRCDLLRDAPAAVPVRAACGALRYVPPAPPRDAAPLLQIVDYVGAAWEDVVRCGGGKVRYFSE